jgi:hypothetical protein
LVVYWADYWAAYSVAWKAFHLVVKLAHLTVDEREILLAAVLVLQMAASRVDSMVVLKAAGMAELTAV